MVPSKKNDMLLHIITAICLGNSGIAHSFSLGERGAKVRKLWTALIALGVLFTAALAQPAQVFAVEGKGVAVSIQADAQEYDAGDVATLTVVLTNESDVRATNVSYVIELPEGMRLAEGESLTGTIDELASGETVSREVHATVLGSTSGTGSGNANNQDEVSPEGGAIPTTGDVSTTVVAALALAGVGAIAAALLLRKRSGASMLLLALCVVAAGSIALAATSTAYANEGVTHEVEASRELTLGGKKQSVRVHVSYVLPEDGGEGPAESISRAEWICMLLEGTKTPVSESAETSFEDVSGHSFEREIATAEQLGIILGEEPTFNPDAPASREFAATTATLLAGFVDDGEALDAVDAGEAQHPGLLSVAVDLDLISLDDQGYIYPMRNVSASDAQHIIDEVDGIINGGAPSGDEGVDVVFQDDVIQINDYMWRSQGEFSVSMGAYDLKVGSKVALASSEDNPAGAAGVVTGIYEEDGRLVATFEQATQLEEIFKSISIHAYDVTVDEGDIVLEDGVELVERPQTYADGSWSPGTLNLDFGERKLGKHMTVSGGLGITPTVSVACDWSLVSGFKELGIGIENELSADAKIEADATAIDDSVELEIPLFKVNVHLGWGFAVSPRVGLHVGASGEANVGASVSQEAGVRLVEGHIRSYGDIDSDVTAQAEAEAEAAGTMSVALTGVGFDLAEVGLEAGARATGDVILRDTGMVCSSVDAKLYSDLKAELILVGEYSTSLINQKHNPFYWAFHWEDGKLVDECTYDDSGEPGTDPDSEFIYEAADGGIVIRDYVGEASSIVIPVSIDGKDVVGVSFTNPLDDGTGLAYQDTVESISFAPNSKVTVFDYGYAGMEPEHDALNSVDFENARMMTYIEIYDAGKLSKLDLSGLSKLETAIYYTVADNRGFEGVALKGNNALTVLRVAPYADSMTSPALSEAPNLETLELHWCGFDEIDVSHNTKLVSLAVTRNPISSLDISKNTSLVYLDCSWNELTRLDVSNNLLIENLDCTSNRIENIAELEQIAADRGVQDRWYLTPQR